MNEKMKKIISLAMTSFCVAGSLVMFSDVSGKAETIAPVYADGNEVFKTEFFLGAWCEPSATDESFEKYKDVGFNAMYLMNEVQYNSSALVRYLQMGKKHEIKMVIANGANRASPTSLRYQTKYSLADYPAFYGIHACDEPQGDGTKRDESAPNYKPEVEACEKTGGLAYNTIYDYMYAEYQYLNEMYPGKYYSSVLNFSPDKGGFGYGSMDAYAAKVLSGMKKEDRTIEFDKYPYTYDSRVGNGFRNELYWNFLNVANVAKEYEVGKRVFYYQQWFPYALRSQLSAQEITYQLYTAMCFGINGFVAYKYASYWTDYNDLVDFTMNSAWGETELNYYNQIALEEIKKFDNVYLNFADRWEGVLKVKGTEYSSPLMSAGLARLSGNGVLSSCDGIESISATHDTLVGAYKDGEGRNGYMITNQSYSLDRMTDTVSVTFKNAKNAIVIENGEQKTVELKNGTYVAELAPGAGAFIIPLE
ncbi:MAG: hypothetical protein SO532_05080 [Candidatus Borkfalkiaceae bacterium]|nr:hypothetical protein [Christensenellaceae bacterium]